MASAKKAFLFFKIEWRLCGFVPGEELCLFIFWMLLLSIAPCLGPSPDSYRWRKLLQLKQ